jgi:hypothetical protein
MQIDNSICCNYFDVLVYYPFIHAHLLAYRGRRGRERMIVGFTTTCVLGAYHH